jgi:signal transduction histidine kinase
MNEKSLLSIEMPHTFLRGLMLAISLACSGVALLLLIAPVDASSFALRSRPDAILLLVVSIALSLVLYIARREVAVGSLLVARLLLALLIGIPLGPMLSIKLALWSSLVLEACAYLHHPARLPAAAAIIAVELLFQQSFRAWGEPVAPPPLQFVVAAGAMLAGIAVVICTFQHFVEMFMDERRKVAQLDEAVRQLTSANLGFQKVASCAQEQSAEDERKRITREIHDSIGYALTNLIMMMEAAVRLAPETAIRLRELLVQGREEAQLGLTETRRALSILRSVGQREVRGLSAIHRLVSIFGQATGVDVQVSYCNAAQSFGTEADMAIYRMVQEGLTNAFRHGRATLIKLHFWQEPDGLRVILWDNGTAGGNVIEGIGLSGMRERIMNIGGELQFGRIADGFELSAWIPLEGEGDHGDPLIGVG